MPQDVNAAKRSGSAEASVPPKKRPRRPEFDDFAESATPLDLSASACRRRTPSPPSWPKLSPPPYQMQQAMPISEPLSPGWLGRWHSMYARHVYLSSLGLLLPDGRPPQPPPPPPRVVEMTGRQSATASADVCRRPHESVKTANVKTVASPTSTSGETDFLCSCGRAFVSLIDFTLHLKDSGHGPVSAYRDKDIPKLVRGQDMWINSETEQTKEILRCIRCKQSFRTLPDLTMHMVRTKHYAEIIYSDRLASPGKEESNGRRERRPERHEARESVGKDAGGVARLREATQLSMASDGSTEATSALRRMQKFVESRLPNTPPGVFRHVLRASALDEDNDNDNDNDDLQRRDTRRGGGSSGGSSSSYLSPDRPACSENPLSSLQRLVETAERPATVAQPADCRDASTASPSSQSSPPSPSSSSLPSPPPSPPAPASRSPGSIAAPESANPVDLTRQPRQSAQRQPARQPELGEKLEKSERAERVERAEKAWQDAALQKKAKCQFCSKPFANKGQVRLHVSKGKCPSLLSRVQSTMPSPLAVSPFAYFGGFDYLKAASQLQAAGLLTPDQILRACNKEMPA